MKYSPWSPLRSGLLKVYTMRSAAFPSNSLSPDAFSSGEVIQAFFDRDKLASALSAVTAAQADTEVGWIQLDFTGGGNVLMSAVSHNLSIRYVFQAEYTGKGIFKVSGKQLSDYVKQLPPERITLTAEMPQRLTLKCGRSSARLQLVQDQTHTEVVVPTTGSSLLVKGEALERWVNCFRDFVSVDDTRFYANGALIWADSSNGLALHAVASDALRLAKAELLDGLMAETIEGSAVLVPKKALDELRRVCSLEPEKEFRLRWHQDSLFFAVETDNYTMVSKCIAGKYPPYTSAIPQKINTEVDVELKSFSESVRRVLLFADKNRIIKLNFDGPVLDVQSFTPGLKEGEEIVELGTPVSEPIQVNYNGTLLTGILNCVNGSKVKFSWENVNRPVKVTGEAQKGLSVFFLLVPTRF
jgi:DNA polymerase-3 subunit beta